MDKTEQKLSLEKGEEIKPKFETFDQAVHRVIDDADGGKRRKDESYEEYKLRLKSEKIARKAYLRGTWVRGGERKPMLTAKDLYKK